MPPHNFHICYLHKPLHLIPFLNPKDTDEILLKIDQFCFCFLPKALGLFLGTIYLRVHYFVDLVAGFILGLICFAQSADYIENGKVEKS